MGRDPVPAMEELKLVGVDPQEKLPTDNVQEKIKPNRRASSSSRKPAAKKTVNLETRIAGTLVQINFFIMLSPWREDALAPDEIKALAHAINAQAQTSTYFRKAVEASLGVASAGELIGVVMVIAMRRAMRRGMIPEQFAMFLAMPESDSDESVDLRDETSV